jgi:glycerophosphoryl diester phosphodiesterase
MIEFDCRLTKDNELAVIHDALVNRTSNGKGHVSNLTMKQMSQLDFGSWFSDKFRNERIPTLSEVLLRYREKMFFDIELKSERGFKEKSILCQRVVEVLNQTIVRDKVMISSFSRTILKIIRKMDDTLFLGLLVENRLETPFMNRFVRNNNIDSVIFNHKILNNFHLDKLKKMNKFIMVYTVNDKKDYDRCKKLGANFIISDNPYNFSK